MDAEGNELLPSPEDLDLLAFQGPAGDLRKRRIRSIGQKAFRPEPDPHERVAEPRPHDLVDAVSQVGIEDVDVDADQAAGSEADPVGGVLPDPFLDRSLIDRYSRPTRPRRSLLSRDDRQRRVAVVVKPERRVAECDRTN